MSAEPYPLVSIITCYYNRKDNLEASISSILDQSYPNFEFIIFDDCSTDGTFELLQQFADHPKVRIIRPQMNMGMTKGLVWAISKAKGKYIAIHGAGDVSYRDRIQKQVQFLEAKPDFGIVGCLIEEIYENQKTILSPEGKRGLKFSHGEVMYRSSLYFQAGGYNTLFVYGQFTMLKYDMLKLSRGGYVEEVLYRRIHYSGGVTRNSTKRLLQVLNIQLGICISRQGLWNVDISLLVIALSFQYIALIRKGSEDESRLKYHLKRKSFFFSFIFWLNRVGLIPNIVVEKFGVYLRRQNGFL